MLKWKKHHFYLFLNFIFSYGLHSALFCINFRCAAQWLDSHGLYKVSPDISGTHWHHTSYYNIVDCIPCDALYRDYSVTTNLRLNPSTFFTLSLNCPLVWQRPESILKKPHLKNIYILFISERGEERGKERERNINVWLPLTCPPLGTWPATQACAPTGNRTSDPLVCGAANQSGVTTESHQPGLKIPTFKCIAET